MKPPEQNSIVKTRSVLSVQWIFGTFSQLKCDNICGFDQVMFEKSQQIPAEYGHNQNNYSANCNVALLVGTSGHLIVAKWQL